MISHNSPDDFKEWVRERRRETNARRVAQQEYVARCRSYDAGVQWLSRGVAGNQLDSQALRAFKQAGRANVPDGGTAPLRTTLNKITENIRRVQGATAPKKIDARSTPDYGVGRGFDIVQSDIAEAIANATISDSGALGVCRTANFERCIDGMHGFGYRIERQQSAEGQFDARLQCFNFDGFQLTLDPNVTDQCLDNHEYVILTEVVTEHAARRRYGDDQVDQLDTDKLPEVGMLRPIERRFNALTGGILYPEMGSLGKAKGMIVHTVFLRGSSKRFDRMYTVLDMGRSDVEASKSSVVTNWEINQGPGGGNPYGGNGMPLFLLFGHRRSKDLHGISDVGMMVDAQDKLNIAASIYFQSLWNYVQKVVFVDRRTLEDQKSSPSQIMKQMRQGILMLNVRDRNSMTPQMLQMPQPPQAVANDMQRFSDDVRNAGFRSSAHAGETKSHVADATVERTIEATEITADDRVDSDIAEYERFVESITSTQIRLAQAGSISSQRLLFDAGLSDEQVGLMLRIDPFRSLPRLKIAEESIRRRSRSQQKRDISMLAQSGAFSSDPDEMRRLLVGIDMPVSNHDKTIQQASEIMAVKIAMGEPFMPYPMGRDAMFLIEALRRQAAQASNPQSKQMIIQAIQMQQAVEQQAAQAAAPPQEQGPASFQDIANQAFNPGAAR